MAWYWIWQFLAPWVKCTYSKRLKADLMLYILLWTSKNLYKAEYPPCQLRFVWCGLQFHPFSYSLIFFHRVRLRTLLVDEIVAVVVVSRRLRRTKDFDTLQGLFLAFLLALPFKLSQVSVTAWVGWGEHALDRECIPGYPTYGPSRCWHMDGLEPFDILLWIHALMWWRTNIRTCLINSGFTWVLIWTTLT